MKPTSPALAVFATVALWAFILVAPRVGAADLAMTPLVGDVLWPPRVARVSDDQRHLVYELRLANPTPAAIDLTRIDVIEPRSGRPAAIAHRVSVVLRPDRAFTVTTAETSVIDGKPVVLGPPLVGTGYLAGDGCCDTIRHVRALLPLNGRFALAQRFAIDWEQIDGENRLGKGDLTKVESFTIFGKEVIAVADGTVIAARNDLPEQVPGKLPANMTIDRADWNFVVLDIGGGAFALYAHMQPGSVRVVAGAKVKRGDLLGKVGNTGNTSSPHLHFHVMDGPSPLTSNGIPYVIDRFTIRAIDKAGTADFDKAEATGSPLTVVDFSR